jgi:hypothetical protein
MDQKETTAIQLPAEVAGYIQGLKDQIAVLSDMAAQRTGEIMSLRIQLELERKKSKTSEKQNEPEDGQAADRVQR